jgi:hypothetical protein
MYFIALKLKQDLVKPDMVAVVVFEGQIDGVEDETQEIPITSKSVLMVYSNPRQKFSSTIYEAKVLLYADASKTQLLGTHIQYIPSNVNTDDSLSWEELNSRFEQ